MRDSLNHPHPSKYNSTNTCQVNQDYLPPHLLDGLNEENDRVDHVRLELSIEVGLVVLPQVLLATGHGVHHAPKVQRKLLRNAAFGAYKKRQHETEKQDTQKASCPTTTKNKHKPKNQFSFTPV